MQATRPRSAARYPIAVRLTFAAVAVTPVAGLWAWTATSLGDSLAAAVLTGMGVLGAVSLVPHQQQHGG